MRILATAGLALALAGAAPAQQAQSWRPYSAGLQAQAAAGDAAAQFELGEAFRTGNGIAPDREQAIGWYRKASARDIRAADALSVLLFTKGERRQAIPLLQAAAGRGNPYALYILGTARFNGDTVPKEMARAYADMRIAAATLPQARRSLGLMEPYLTAEDRRRADLLAARPGGPEAGAPAATAYATVPGPVPPAPAARRIAKPAPAAGAANGSGGAAGPGPGPGPGPAAAGAIDSPPSLPAPPPFLRQGAIVPVSGLGSGGWKIQLGAYGSEERAAVQWDALRAKVPALAGLRKITLPAGGLVRLQADGLASREAAAELCRAVVETGGGCFVVGQ